MDSVASPQDKVVKPSRPEPVTGPAIASWILMGIGLLAVVLLHLVSALVAGLLVYELVSLLAPFIERHLIHRWSRWLAVASLAILTIVALILAWFGVAAFLKSEAGSPQILSEKLNQVITEARDKLPPFMVESFPGNVDRKVLAVRLCIPPDRLRSSPDFGIEYGPYRDLAFRDPSRTRCAPTAGQDSHRGNLFCRTASGHR